MDVDRSEVRGRSKSSSIRRPNVVSVVKKKKAFVSFKDAHLLRKRLLNYSAQLPKGFMVNMISNKRSN